MRISCGSAATGSGKRRPRSAGRAGGGTAIDRIDQSDRTERADPVGPTDQPIGSLRPWLTNTDPAVVANALHLPDSPDELLARPADRRAGAGLHAGGRLQRATGGGAHRGAAKAAGDDRPMRRSVGSRQLPTCPRCGKPMALRTARKGAHAGSQFWGCTGYPECKGTRRLEASGGSELTDQSRGSHEHGRPKGAEDPAAGGEAVPREAGLRLSRQLGGAREQPQHRAGPAACLAKDAGPRRAR